MRIAIIGGGIGGLTAAVALRQFGFEPEVFERFEQRRDGIVAHFAGGRSFECDALIGADGLHSHARAQLLNDGPATERDYRAWRGVVESAPTSITPGIAYEIYGSGRRFGI